MEASTRMRSQSEIGMKRCIQLSIRIRIRVHVGMHTRLRLRVRTRSHDHHSVMCDDEGGECLFCDDDDGDGRAVVDVYRRALSR